MPMISDERIMGFKIESVKGTFESVDFDLVPREISLSHEFEEYVRKYATGEHGFDSSVIGKKAVTCTFSIDMAGSGSLGVAPSWAKVLKACGYKETISAGVSVAYTPDVASDCVSASIDVRDLVCGASKQVSTKIAGAMGSVKFILDSVGNPVRAEFEFKGKFVSIDDIANPVFPSLYDVVVPPAVLDCSINLMGVQQYADKFEITSGESVQMSVNSADSSGYGSSYIEKREMVGSLDPEKRLVADDSIVGNWASGQTGIFETEIGSVAGNIIKITGSNVQINGANPADRNGAVTYDVSLRFLRTIGNDELTILFK